MRGRRRWPWLIAALGLLGLAALLMMAADERTTEKAVRVRLPRNMDRVARERLERRRTLPRFVTGPETSPDKTDPVLTALPSKVDKGALVFEASAVRNSPVGQLLMQCLLAQSGQEFEAIKAQSGVDLLQDVDRIAIADDTIVVAGRFGQARWDQLQVGQSPAGGRPYGDRAMLFERGQGAGNNLATWGDDMIVIAKDTAQVQAAIDRLDGRVPTAAPVIGEQSRYGEIYGVLMPEVLKRMMPGKDLGVVAQLQGFAQRVELHVDTSSDVGIVADVIGGDQRQADDLGKTLGAALSLGRVAALAEGRKDLADLLGFAAVKPGRDGQFRTELGLPLSYLEGHLQTCVTKGRERAAAVRTDAGPPSPAAVPAPSVR